MPAQSTSSSASGTRTWAARKATAANASSVSATWLSGMPRKHPKTMPRRIRSSSSRSERRESRYGTRVFATLHQAAQAEACDFEGLGPHSFRRANITWRQQVGGTSIEASKIAGHSDLEMTGEYTCVSPERQNQLTRRIQQKLRDAVGKNGKGKIVQLPVPISRSSRVQHLLSVDANSTINNTGAPS